MRQIDVICGQASLCLKHSQLLESLWIPHICLLLLRLFYQVFKKTLCERKDKTTLSSASLLSPPFPSPPLPLPSSSLFLR